MNGEKEIIICAAVMASNGTPFRCHRHNHGFMAISLSALKPSADHSASQGFITSRNRFVSRAEAKGIQVAAGVDSLVGYRPDGQLYSEDLY